MPFGLAMLNSVLVAGSISISVMFFSTLAGFAFAKLRFRGRNILLLMTVGTMMVPTLAGIIPLYILMVKLEWVGSLYAVVVPALVNAFGVFFMTQFLSRALPTELLEAGRVDGCTHLGPGVARRLPGGPAGRGGARHAHLHDGLERLHVAAHGAHPENPTVQVALSTLAAGYVNDYVMGLAGTALGTLPLVIVFALLGKHIIGGIMQGAVKG